MGLRQRTVLIVEDAPDFRLILEMGCTLAFKNFTHLLSEIRRDRGCKTRDPRGRGAERALYDRDHRHEFQIGG